MKQNNIFFKSESKLWWLSFCLLPTLFSCITNVDEQKLVEAQIQLKAIYSQCGDENINSLQDLENILNNGGNGLSKKCRKAIGLLDFKSASEVLDFNLDFEIPEPKKIVNPILDTKSWITISKWNSQNNQMTFSSLLENVDLENVKLMGKSFNGELQSLKDFTLNKINAADCSVAYTTDYSASMLKSDLVTLSTYQNSFQTILPKETTTMVQIFSRTVDAKYEGFSTSTTEVTKALLFDENYKRGTTALFDAWHIALSSLESQNKKIKLNILATDGYENNSKIHNESELRNLIKKSNAFNLIIASGWAETKRLKSLVGNKGIVLYKYEIDEAIEVISDISKLLSNLATLRIDEDLSNFSELHLILDEGTELIFSL